MKITDRAQRLLGAAVIALVPAGAIASDDAQTRDLASKAGCLSCHAMAEKVVGPSFKDIAARYADDKDAVATLAHRIRIGGKGNWGRIAMPANGSLSEAEAKALAAWVMKQKG